MACWWRRAPPSWVPLWLWRWLKMLPAASRERVAAPNPGAGSEGEACVEPLKRARTDETTREPRPSARDIERLAAASAALPALNAAAYEPCVVDLLFGLLCDVARRRQPQVELALRGEPLPTDVPRAVWRRSLQAQGIWF